jgi:hypothetical protein
LETGTDLSITFTGIGYKNNSISSYVTLIQTPDAQHEPSQASRMCSVRERAGLPAYDHGMKDDLTADQHDMPALKCDYIRY